jgi:type III restriction enzyme
VLAGFVGQPRWSLANWLALHEPLLIVDEAHNTKTDKSFTALKRLNPSAILELTATPIPGKSNVLYHVSAQELAAEAMIKLPIALAEHPQGLAAGGFCRRYKASVRLEAEALKDEAAGNGYVRPIVLFQAQNENDEVPSGAVLRKYLEDELHVPPDRIKIATGDTTGAGRVWTCPLGTARCATSLPYKRCARAGTALLPTCCARCKNCPAPRR